MGLAGHRPVALHLKQGPPPSKEWGSTSDGTKPKVNEWLRVAFVRHGRRMVRWQCDAAQADPRDGGVGPGNVFEKTPP